MKTKNELNAFFAEIVASCNTCIDAAMRLQDSKMKKEQSEKYTTKRNYVSKYLLNNEFVLSCFYRLNDDEVMKLVNASYSLEKLAALAAVLKSKNASSCFDDPTLQALAILQEHDYKRTYTNQSLRIKTMRDNYGSFHKGTQQNYVLNLFERVGLMNTSKNGSEKVYSVNQSSPLLETLKSIKFVNPAK